MVYMGAKKNMYIDGVYGLHICVQYTCVLIVHMGDMYIYIDCVYGCIMHVY